MADSIARKSASITVLVHEEPSGRIGLNIPSRGVGSGRRVLRENLFASKQESLTRRRAVLEELAALSQDLKMGY